MRKVIIPIWIKRWKDLARIKTLDAVNDERHVQICREYGDVLAGRKLKVDEEVAVTIIAIPSHDKQEIKKYLEGLIGA